MASHLLRFDMVIAMGLPEQVDAKALAGVLGETLTHALERWLQELRVVGAVTVTARQEIVPLTIPATDEPADITAVVLDD